MSEGPEKIGGVSGEETPRTRSPKELKKLYRQGKISAPQPQQGGVEPSPQKFPERTPESDKAGMFAMIKEAQTPEAAKEVIDTFLAVGIEATRGELAALLREHFPGQEFDLSSVSEGKEAVRSEGWEVLRREIFDAATSADAEEIFKVLGPEAGMTRDEFIATMKERARARQELVDSAQTPAVADEETAPAEEKASEEPEPEKPAETVTEARGEIPWKETIIKETANVQAAREILGVLKSELLAKAETLKVVLEAKEVIAALDAAMMDGSLDEGDGELLAISGMSAREARVAIRKLAVKTAAMSGLYEAVSKEENPLARLKELLDTVQDIKKKEEIRAVIQKIVRREIHIVAQEVKGLIEIKDPVLLEMMEETSGKIRARQAERQEIWDKVRTALRITRRKQQPRPGAPTAEPKMSAYEKEIARWTEELKQHPEKLTELKGKGIFPSGQVEEIEKRLDQLKRDEQIKLLKERRKEAFDEIRLAMEGGQTAEGERMISLKDTLVGVSLPISEGVQQRIQKVLGAYIKIRAFSDEIRELETTGGL